MLEKWIVNVRQKLDKTSPKQLKSQKTWHGLEKSEARQTLDSLSDERADCLFKGPRQRMVVKLCHYIL